MTLQILIGSLIAAAGLLAYFRRETRRLDALDRQERDAAGR